MKNKLILESFDGDQFIGIDFENEREFVAYLKEKHLNKDSDVDPNITYETIYLSNSVEIWSPNKLDILENPRYNGDIEELENVMMADVIFKYE